MRILRVVLLWTAAVAGMPGARYDVMEGNPASPVKVVIYEDLQCGDCQTLRTLLDEKVLPKYGARVAFQHRDMPLGRHEWARPAAIADRWVAEQSSRLAVNMRRELLAQQNSITLQNLPAWLREFASRNKLDQQAIVDALTDARLSAIVDQDIQSAQVRGVTKVPTVFVGSISFEETILFDDLARAIEDALPR
jgi:protein-disulfide isomerase